MADSHELIVSLLEPNRLARTVFCLVGFAQAVRHIESFYHVMALSLMCELLVIPEYIIMFFRLPSRTEWPERMANVCASTFAILMNGYLAVTSWCWERTAGSCYTEGQIQNPIEFLYLTKIVPGSLAMMIFLVLDLIFIIFSVTFPTQETRDGHKNWGPFSGLQKWAIGGGIAFELILTIRLVRLIFDLYSLAGPEQMSWGFGQIVSIATAGLGIILALHKYSFQICTIGEEEMTRGRQWFNQIGCAHLKLSADEFIVPERMRTWWPLRVSLPVNELFQRLNQHEHGNRDEMTHTEVIELGEMSATEE